MNWKSEGKNDVQFMWFSLCVSSLPPIYQKIIPPLGVGGGGYILENIHPWISLKSQEVRRVKQFFLRDLFCFG